MRAILKKMLRSEDGATAIEYGLIAALIAIAIIGGATALGGGLDGLFQGIADNPVLDSATP